MLETRATLAKRRSDVASMFDGVARRYDLLNDVMTLGVQRQWRRDVVEAVAPRPGQRVLDIAAGTGTSSATFAAAGAEVFAADISLGMLGVGRERQPHITFVAGDAMQLPFDDAVFDTVTISYGLRNVEDTLAGLREMRRVTKPGGQIVICEFSTPIWGPMKAFYREWMTRIIPAMSRFSSNKPAYDYLAESILAWHDQQALAALMEQAGWGDVAWRNLSQGMVALHRGRAA